MTHNKKTGVAAWCHPTPGLLVFTPLHLAHDSHSQDDCSTHVASSLCSGWKDMAKGQRHVTT